MTYDADTATELELETFCSSSDDWRGAEQQQS